MAFKLADIVGIPREKQTWPLSKGQRVRIVSMRGCMAHERANIREGVVQGFTKRNLYNGSTGAAVVMARIKINGEVVERVCDPSNDWIFFEDVWEYRE